jgi:hypothetical protein
LDVCSNKHGTHKPSRIDLNPMAAEVWPSSPISSSSGSVLSSMSEVLPLRNLTYPCCPT